MKISWDDIGRSPIPGTYFVGDTNIVVREADISVWREHPSAVFNTTWYKRGQMIGAKSLADWAEPFSGSEPAAGVVPDGGRT